MNKLKKILGQQILFFDGGTGSVLQAAGLKPGELPEIWNITHKEQIVNLHYNYFASGSNIVNTNTFGAFRTKFFEKTSSLEKIVVAAIENANIARDKYLEDCAKKNRTLPDCFITFDIGPTGKLLKPMGDLDFEDAVSLYKNTFEIAFTQKIDAVLIETMSDSYETKAAVIAAKETLEKLNILQNDLPIFVSNAYNENGRLLTGATPEAMVALLEGLGVDALGINCSLGPEQMISTIEKLISSSSTPIIVKPNAGIPHDENGKAVFDVKADDFAASMKKIAELGACVLGGCCGTTPEYIEKLSNSLKDFKIPHEKLTQKNKTIVSSYTHTVELGDGNVPVLIGERINPTGKKKFKEALRQNDIPYIIHQGIEQEEKGAHILDVNVGLPEIDEKSMMVNVMCELQGVLDLPLQIDTSSAEVMDAALRRYNGKALVNSVNGKQEVMNAIFPLVKKYGGVVVGLTLDEDGIPESVEGRLKIAQKIYDTAQKFGISKNDVIIDALTMAVSASPNAAQITLETVKKINEFGGKTILGVSNISFGLPARENVTQTFFTLALQNGLSAAIMNVQSIPMMSAWHCFCLLNQKDKDCLKYIEWAQKDSSTIRLCPEQPSPETTVKNDTSKTSENSPLQYAIIHGLKDDAASATTELLQNKDALEIIEKDLIPGLDFVGKRFAEKTMFLPQLLMAADAAKSAFSVIKDYLEKSGKTGKSKGKVILATVHGDIHDIGKNIVKVLLENYDFEVLDLGKDVPPQVIVDACKKNKVQLVGLSALMTTTVPAMKQTIELLRKEAPWAKVCVGGAVMTQEYADSIGADFYGKDAMSTVNFANEMFLSS